MPARAVVVVPAVAMLVPVVAARGVRAGRSMVVAAGAMGVVAMLPVFARVMTGTGGRMHAPACA